MDFRQLIKKINQCFLVASVSVLSCKTKSRVDEEEGEIEASEDALSLLQGKWTQKCTPDSTGTFRLVEYYFTGKIITIKSKVHDDAKCQNAPQKSVNLTGEIKIGEKKNIGTNTFEVDITIMGTANGQTVNETGYSLMDIQKNTITEGDCEDTGMDCSTPEKRAIKLEREPILQRMGS